MNGSGGFGHRSVAGIQSASSTAALGAAGAFLSQFAAIGGGSTIGGGPAWVFDEFDRFSLATEWQVNGTWLQSTTVGPGVWTCASTGGNVLQRATTQSAWVANPAVTPWQLAGRFKMTGAIVAADVKGFSLQVGSNLITNNSVHVGIRQAISATKFVFSATKATVLSSALSTVSIDANFHVLNIWFDGTSMWGSVDGEAPVFVCLAAALPIVPMCERLGVEAGTGAAQENFFDYEFVAANRTVA